MVNSIPVQLAQGTKKACDDYYQRRPTYLPDGHNKHVVQLLDGLIARKLGCMIARMLDVSFV